VAGRIVESVPEHRLEVSMRHPGDGRGAGTSRSSPSSARSKIGLFYPVNQDLARLLADALAAIRRWDMP